MPLPQTPLPNDYIVERTFLDGAPSFTEFRVQVDSVKDFILSRAPKLGDLAVFVSEYQSSINRAWYWTKYGWVDWIQVDIKATHPSYPSRCLTIGANGFKWINKTAISASRKRLFKHVDELSAHKCISLIVKQEAAKKTRDPRTEKKTLQRREQRRRNKERKNISDSEYAGSEDDSMRNSEISMICVEDMMNDIGVTDDDLTCDTNDENCSLMDVVGHGNDNIAEPEARNSTRDQPNNMTRNPFIDFMNLWLSTI